MKLSLDYFLWFGTCIILFLYVLYMSWLLKIPAKEKTFFAKVLVVAAQRFELRTQRVWTVCSSQLS